MKTSIFNPRLAALLLAVGAALYAVGCDKGTGGGDDITDDELRAQLIAEGEAAFPTCVACHGERGKGESAPPLLHSDYLIAQRMRPAHILLLGLPNVIDENPIVVNGITHENSMPAIASEWSDRKIAAVLTYVRAVLNDSTSVNCTPGGVEDSEGHLVPDCDIVASPAEATTMIKPSEVKALRDSLRTAGLLE